SLTCAALLGPIALAGGESLAIPSWKDAGWLLVYGVTGQVFGWVLISNALPKLNAAAVGLLLSMQPVGAYIWDILFFDRRLSPLQFTGGALTLIAIYLGSVKAGRRRESQSTT